MQKDVKTLHIQDDITHLVTNVWLNPFPYPFIDKWLLYGMLEMDLPYDRRSEKCIVRGVRSLYIDTIDTLVEISSTNGRCDPTG